MLEAYELIIADVGIITVGAVVNALVKAVCVSEGEPDTSLNVSNEAVPAIVYTSDGRPRRLILDDTAKTFSTFVKELYNKDNRGDICIIDRNNSTASLYDAVISKNNHELRRFERHAYMRSQLWRLMTSESQSSLPFTPEKEIADRKIIETEVLTFSSLSRNDHHKYCQFVEFDKILESKPLPNFTGLVRPDSDDIGSVLKRKFFRDHSASTFAEIVSEEISSRTPKVLKAYYPMTDQLLYAMCWPPLNRRHEVERYHLSDFSHMKNIGGTVSDPDSMTTPKASSKAGATQRKPGSASKSKNSSLTSSDPVDVDFRVLHSIEQSVLTVTPAGGEVLAKVFYTSSSQDAWMRVFLNDSVLGVDRGDSSLSVEQKKQRSAVHVANKARAAVAMAAIAASLDPQQQQAAVANNSDPALSAEAVANLPGIAASPAAEENEVSGAKEGKLSPRLSPRGGAKEGKMSPRKPLGKLPPTSKAKNMADVAAAAGKGAKDKKKIDAKSVPAPVVETVDATTAPTSSESSKPSSGNKTTKRDAQEDPPIYTGLAPSGTFFCQTDDGVRFSVCEGLSPFPVTKPDKFGTICVSSSFPSGLRVTTCTSGDIVFDCSGQPQGTTLGHILRSAVQLDGPALADEASRCISAGGIVVRTLRSGPYAKDVMHPDGTRILIRRREHSETDARTAHTPHAPIPGASSLSALSLSNNVTNLSSNNPAALPSVASSSVDSVGASSQHQHSRDTVRATAAATGNDFHSLLVNSAPIKKWTYVRLGPKGSVLFFATPPESDASGQTGFPPSFDASNPRKLPSADIMHSFFDVETNSRVSSFLDGRVIIQYDNGQREVRFPDTTCALLHSNKSSLVLCKLSGTRPEVTGDSINRPAYMLPTVEIDLGVDAVCRRHAKGEKIPINKGGNRIRSLVALPDGSALMIKYSTSIVSPVTGSIKVVRRDRACIQAFDNGLIEYTLPSAWSAEAAAEFAKECEDGSITADMAAGKRASRGKRVGFPGDSASSLSATFTCVNEFDVSEAERMGKCAGPGNSGNKSKTKRATIFEPAAVSCLPNPKPVVVLSPTMTVDNILAAPKPFKYSVNILKLSCLMIDKDHNTFDIDLLDPLNPHVDLSGEVLGLKPTAVSEEPIDSRLFIVSRGAEATEILSSTAVEELERAWQLDKADIARSSTSAPSDPSDLGGSSLHSYYRRRRQAVAGDYFNFQEVFLGRHAAWGNFSHLPSSAVSELMRLYRQCQAATDGTAATVSFLGHKQSIGGSNGLFEAGNGSSGEEPESKSIAIQGPIPTRRDDSVTDSLDADNDLECARIWNNALQPVAATPATPSTRVFDSIHILEHSPLSTKGYEELQKSLSKWEAFCEARVSSMHRFKVEETRSPAELDLEEKIKIRLKSAYKAAKLHRKKEQQAESLVVAQLAPPTGDVTNKSVDWEQETKRSRKTQLVTVAEEREKERERDAGGEGDGEDAAEDSGDAFSDSDDGEEEESPEDIGVREAFSDFASMPSAALTLTIPAPLSPVSLGSLGANNSYQSSPGTVVSDDDDRRGGEGGSMRSKKRSVPGRIQLSELRRAMVQILHRNVDESDIHKAVEVARLMSSSTLDYQDFRAVYDILQGRNIGGAGVRRGSALEQDEGEAVQEDVEEMGRTVEHGQSELLHVSFLVKSGSAPDAEIGTHAMLQLQDRKERVNGRSTAVPPRAMAQTAPAALQKQQQQLIDSSSVRKNKGGGPLSSSQYPAGSALRVARNVVAAQKR